MSFRDRILESLGLVTERRLKKEKHRAWEAGVVFGSGEDEPAPGGGPGGARWGYRLQRVGSRDVTEISYSEAVERVWSQYVSNPIARRLLNTQRDLICDTGVRARAKDERAQAVLDAFWDDPVNRMGKFVYDVALQQFLFGTQVFKAHVDLKWQDGGIVGTGRVRLGYIDPGEINDIVLDPDNARVPVVVKVKRQAREELYRVIHVDDRRGSATEGLLIGAMPDLDEKSRTFGKLVDEHGEVYDGSCFLFRVNCLMNGKWGWPDTLHLVDWLDQADKFFFDIAERIYFLTTFVWDVLRRGATPEECREYARSIGAPKRASVQVHNENEEWTPKTPDLGQADIAQAARTLIWFIGGIGFNIPETFLGWGEGTTYAAAKELAAPVRKALQSRQSIIESLCEELCRFQIDQAIIAKQLPPDVDKSVSFNFPSLDVRDVVGAAATFQTLAQAVMVGMGAGLFGRELGLKVLAVAAQELGLELDVAEELEKGTEGAAQVREVLRLLHEAGGVPLGRPLSPKEALSQWKISEEDLERARREFDELMRLFQASQAARGGVSE